MPRQTWSRVGTTFSLRAASGGDASRAVVGQHVLLAFERILAFLEDELDRRADQLEAFAEEVLEIAP
jgi:hypothetical protein